MYGSSVGMVVLGGTVFVVDGVPIVVLDVELVTLEEDVLVSGGSVVLVDEDVVSGTVVVVV